MNERQDQIIAEITALKMLLRDTDYEVTKYAEGLTSCTTQQQIEAYRAAFMEQYGEVIENRKTWRAKINELEEELDGLTESGEMEPESGAEESVEAEPADEPTGEADQESDTPPETEPAAEPEQ